MRELHTYLKPGDVILALKSENKRDAVEELLESLRGDARVADWEALQQAVHHRDAAAIEEDGFSICIAHGRTNSVQGLVLAAGRSDAGVPTPEVSGPVRLFFLAGVPNAVNQDYLRVLGAIARKCKSPEIRQKLLGVKEPARFIELLSGE